MTLLKRNLCSLDGSILLEDIDSSASFPPSSTVSLTIDIREHGIMDGIAWMEEHHVTRLPWVLALLFCWVINPSVLYRIFVRLEQNGTVVEFDFKYDPAQSFHDNIYHAPESFGIKQVWFHI